jgi:hypothetical protein
MIENIDMIFISAFITIFSVGLFAISFASFRKYKEIKLLFVGCVFIFFLAKGFLFSLGLFSNNITSGNLIFYFGIIDVIILVLLFIATLKR